MNNYDAHSKECMTVFSFADSRLLIITSKFYFKYTQLHSFGSEIRCTSTTTVILPMASISIPSPVKWRYCDYTGLWSLLGDTYKALGTLSNIACVFGT
jgi:hypothetical protein